MSQPSNQTSIDSNPLVNNAAITSLAALTQLRRLYIQYEVEAGRNSTQDGKTCYVSNEAAERIFNVNIKSNSHCNWFSPIPRRIINRIEIKDYLGNSIITADYVNPNPNHAVWKAIKDVQVPQIQFNVKLGNDINLGQFNYNVVCFQSKSANEYTVECNINEDRFVVEAFGQCCELILCPYTVKSFKIKQLLDSSTSTDDSMSSGVEMQYKWSENPGVFGIGFSQSMKNESKAMLLVLGIYLNEQYFAKRGCCGRVGNVGLRGILGHTGLIIVGMLIVSIIIFGYFYFVH